MTTTKTVKISTFCDTKVDIIDDKFFIIYSPIEGDINEPWKYAIGNLPENSKISSIKCTGDCEKIHFFEQNGLTFFYLTFYCASFHEITFELSPHESSNAKSPKDHPGFFKFGKSKDGTIFCTFKLETTIIEYLNFSETYSTQFALPDNDDAQFKIKINRISDGYFSIHIENPNDYTIDGLPGDLHDEFALPEDITYVRTFSFVQHGKNGKTDLPNPATSKPKPAIESPQLLQEKQPKFINELTQFLKKSVEKSLIGLLEVQQNVSEEDMVL